MPPYGIFNADNLSNEAFTFFESKSIFFRAEHFLSNFTKSLFVSVSGSHVENPSIKKYFE